MALATAGCSSSHTARYAHAGVGMSADAEPRSPTQTVRRSDVEEDGMEAQIPPPPSIRMAPDDPNEPFSPNYGGRPSSTPASAPAEPASRPNPPPKPSSTPRPKFASTLQ